MVIEPELEYWRNRLVLTLCGDGLISVQNGRRKGKFRHPRFNYLSILGLKLIHVSKRGPGCMW